MVISSQEPLHVAKTYILSKYIIHTENFELYQLHFNMIKNHSLLMDLKNKICVSITLSTLAVSGTGQGPAPGPGHGRMGCMVYVEPFTLHLNRDREERAIYPILRS